MKNLLCLGFLLVAFHAHLALAFNFGCTVLSPSGYYDLVELSDLAKNGHDYYFPLTTQTAPTETYYFGMCKEVVKAGVDNNTRIADSKNSIFISGEPGPNIDLKSKFTWKFNSFRRRQAPELLR